MLTRIGCWLLAAGWYPQGLKPDVYGAFRHGWSRALPDRFDAEELVSLNRQLCMLLN